MNTKLKTIKAEQKAFATYLKNYKQAFKEYQRTGSTSAMDAVETKYDPDAKFEVRSWDFGWYFRHRHAAYCLLRGKTLREIENNIEEQEWHRKLSMSLVNKYYDQFKTEDYPEFPEKITVDSKLTKKDGWVIKEAICA